MADSYADLKSQFPYLIDTRLEKRNPTLAEKPLILQWYNLQNGGNFTGADKILADNPTLKECFPTADDWNKTQDSVIAVERFFRDEVQNYIIGAVKIKGKFLPDMQYGVYNLVYYETYDEETGVTIDAYISYKDNIPVGTLPTNTDYWYPVTLRGQMGASGIGLTFRKKWNETKNYYTDDIVSFNNILWIAKTNNLDSRPVEMSADWEIFFRLNQEASSITMQDNKPLSEGLICANFDNPSLLTGYTITSTKTADSYIDILTLTSTGRKIADRTEKKTAYDYITIINIYKEDGASIEKTITVKENITDYRTVVE